MNHTQTHTTRTALYMSCVSARATAAVAASSNDQTTRVLQTWGDGCGTRSTRRSRSRSGVSRSRGRSGHGRTGTRERDLRHGHRVAEGAALVEHDREAHARRGVDGQRQAFLRQLPDERLVDEGLVAVRQDKEERKERGQGSPADQCETEEEGRGFKRPQGAARHSQSRRQPRCRQAPGQPCHLQPRRCRPLRTS